MLVGRVATEHTESAENLGIGPVISVSSVADPIRAVKPIVMRMCPSELNVSWKHEVYWSVELDPCGSISEVNDVRTRTTRIGDHSFAVFALVFAWPVCRIVGKAGFHPLLGLLVMVPLLNILLVWVLAFADWPALRRSGAGEGER